RPRPRRSAPRGILQAVTFPKPHIKHPGTYPRMAGGETWTGSVSRFPAAPIPPRSSTASSSPRPSATSRHGVAEGHGGDQFAILAACAAQTSKIQLGTAITSVFVRSVPTTARAAAAVDAISGGRFILGIGSSHRVQVEPEHGVPYSKPLTRVRESVAIIRGLLRDGRVGYAGETVR